MNNETAQNQLVVVLKDARKDLSQLLNKLQLAQYIIVVVQNRQDYISLLQSTQPSFIILDLLLLDADGWNIAREIKQNPHTAIIPMVLINSSAESATRVARLEWQNVNCVSEASEPEAVVHLITTRLSELNQSQESVTASIAQSDRAFTQQTEKNPKLAERQLQSINKGLENFASIVSHDLQAPLRSLTMFSELLSSEYQQDLDPKAQQYLEKIGNSSSKMQTLIEDLLAYSRAGKSSQTWIVIDLNQATNQVIENLHSAIATSQAQITVGKLPKVLVNPTEINQLLQNLLENAIKFSVKQNPSIKVTAVQKGEEWLVCITDNGIGIALESQSEIFEAFKRLNSTEDYPGTGMGLAICQKIVERYGGEIGVKSVIDRGSTFYFTLPTNAHLQSKSPTSNLI